VRFSAARDFEPIYSERYMLDKLDQPLEVQQVAMDSAVVAANLPSGST
jgi:hypothetical protein